METQRNEITVKINATMEEIHKIIREKEYEEIDKFSLDDTYFIPENLDIEKISTREILAKALIIRRIKRDGKTIKQITFKIKNIDSKGNILSQKSINCEIKSIEDAKKLLQAIGYREIMNIKENDTEYRKNGFQLAIKDIINGDKLIEIEENEKYDTIEKIIKPYISSFIICFLSAFRHMTLFRYQATDISAVAYRTTLLRSYEMRPPAVSVHTSLFPVTLSEPSF